MGESVRYGNYVFIDIICFLWNGGFDYNLLYYRDFFLLEMGRGRKRGEEKIGYFCFVILV